MQQTLKKLSEKHSILADQPMQIFYGTAKKHKMPVNGTVNDLPLWAIILNIGTASYHPAKYLAKMLSALSKSEHTVDNIINTETSSSSY